MYSQGWLVTIVIPYLWDLHCTYIITLFYIYHSYGILENKPPTVIKIYSKAKIYSIFPKIVLEFYRQNFSLNQIFFKSLLVVLHPLYLNLFSYFCGIYSTLQFTQNYMQ